MSQADYASRQRQRTPNNRTTTGFRISDQLWAVLQPLVPVHVNTHRFGGGRPRVLDRTCADAIFYVLRTGCQWQALDQTELSPHSTAHDRFQIWVEAGVFLQLWRAGVARFDELRGIEWEWLAMDGALTKAPLGGGKTGRNPTDRGKSGVKRSVLTEGQGVPIGLVVDGANRHDMKLVRSTLESLVVARPAPTGEQPQGMCLDKGYDYPDVREILQAFGYTAHIRARGEEAKAIQRDAGFKARRWVVERAFVDEPLSPPAGPLGQETGELPGIPAFRLWLDRVSCRWVIRIGTKPNTRSWLQGIDGLPLSVGKRRPSWRWLTRYP